MNNLTFNNHSIELVSIDNKPYMAISQVSDALGYKTSAPLFNIYSRHSDEFTEDMACIFKMKVQGQERLIRVFSLRGCHLLAMFSKTPIAKQFRKWVLDVIETRDKNNQPQITPAIIGGMVKRCVSKAFRDELTNISHDDRFHLCVNLFDKLITNIKEKAYKQARVDERKKITDLLQAMQ